MGLFSKIASVAGTGIGAYFGGPVGASIGSSVGGSLGSYFDERSSVNDAYKQNVNLWNLQNAYNHPKEQMKRLKEAGLNPNLVYGSGNVTGNTTSSPVSPGRRNLTGFPDIMQYHQLKNLESQRNLYDAQVLKNYYDIDLLSTKNDIEKEKLRILQKTGVFPGTSVFAGPSGIGLEKVEKGLEKVGKKLRHLPDKQKYIEEDSFLSTPQERKESYEKVESYYKKNPNAGFFEYWFN